jgi:hypothetical protein
MKGKKNSTQKVENWNVSSAEMKNFCFQMKTWEVAVLNEKN